MVIKTNEPSLELDLIDLANLFGQHNLEIEHNAQKTSGKVQNYFTVKDNDNGFIQSFSFSYDLDENLSDLEKKSITKKMVKNHLYQILSKLLKISLPWGSLTGVRPTKLARDMIEKGQTKEYLVAEALEKEFYLSAEKAKLVANILKNQKCIIRNDNLVDLYINIPLCPTRCLYCSFISHQISTLKESEIDEYLDCLEKEFDEVKKIVAEKAYIIRTVYIGGGTPSVLDEKRFERLLKMVSFAVNEFTVECGRADTITEQKLELMKKYGVSRISINPQSFCQATLKRIGRVVTNSQVFEAYSKALEKGFVVNMDFIAGLPGERKATFKKTMQTALELYPHNITIHTLSVKNGAELRWQQEILNEKDVEAMVSLAENILVENGYKPYYLYRQKNQLKGLENVGYFRDEHVCVFNIDSMEETNTIIGVGAGAMSKRVFNIEKKIERQHNDKFLRDYCQKIEKIIEDKRKFFK